MSTWTNPDAHVWTVGEQGTADTFNQFQRDNQRATVHRYITKQTDENVVASTVQQNDNELLLAMSTNETWYIQLYLRWDGVPGNLNVFFTVPASGTFSLWATSQDEGMISTFRSLRNGSSAQGFGDGSATLNTPLAYIYGICTTAGTSGNLQLTWAQNSASGTTTVKKGSTLFAERLIP